MNVLRQLVAISFLIIVQGKTSIGQLRESDVPKKTVLGADLGVVYKITTSDIKNHYLKNASPYLDYTLPNVDTTGTKPPPQNGLIQLIFKRPDGLPAVFQKNDKEIYEVGLEEYERILILEENSKIVVGVLVRSNGFSSKIDERLNQKYRVLQETLKKKYGVTRDYGNRQIWNIDNGYQITLTNGTRPHHFLEIRYLHKPSIELAKKLRIMTTDGF